MNPMDHDGCIAAQWTGSGEEDDEEVNMSQLMHEIAGTFRLCIATGLSVCVLGGAVTCTATSQAKLQKRTWRSRAKQKRRNGVRPH